jgi:hypothetical protein
MESKISESSSNNIVKEDIKYPSTITNIEFNQMQTNLLAVGDRLGRISLFDIRTNKAVKLIQNKNEKIDIKYIFLFIYIHLKFSSDGNSVYYSQGGMIYLCDLKSDKLILNEKNIINLLKSDVIIGEQNNLKINEINDVK